MKTAMVWPGLALLSSAVLLSASGVSETITRLNIELNGNPQGSGTYTVTTLEDEGLQIATDFRIEESGGSTNLRVSLKFDSHGNPTESTLFAGQGGEGMTDVKATFSATGAKVDVNYMGMRQEAEVPLPAGASAKNPSAFWFVRDTPASGDSFKYWDFSLERFTWEAHTVTYHGPHSVTIGGQNFTGHRVTLEGEDGSKTENVMDDQGNPLQITQTSPDGPTVVVKRA